ncbi:putative NAD-dependent epimerase/dehydratase [Actinoplanes missouriensis 431]|uniref:Putative NAD-dependent epimerase/dehydratase n=1 Tax=Actinoplanes missouriensis (strain ATCC 14538 / DSM 43046 / CBS 188.64 / JCM 3121 / NBRC 102363 / NCIMB 12654 / NRRL B-3342 / UNCC 431) TaxID=512565 RepID=I0H9S5_ACTM4|nr:NAD(P)-dependent oxidoreductase [Actinoplanes missouriensis]BAL89762.1 putative NAD-dependent epimerase/dehydratase [Actinoplanes missouriensis 431]
MRVFITGANGFIGRELALRFRDLGHIVDGVDLRPDPEAGVIGGDITREGPWQDFVADLVVHTAAVVSNGVGMDEQWRVTTLGTRKVLDAAVRNGARWFLHLSSIRAFSDVGFPDGVTEEHPVRPDGNPYVDTKIASEQVVLQAHAAGEIAVTVVRPGDVYGPGSRPWTLMPLELIKKNQFLLPANGNGIFSPVYIDDLIEGLLIAANSHGNTGQVFTLTGGVGVTCKEFFGHYYRMLGKRGPLCLPTPVAVGIAAAAGRAIGLTGASTEFNAISMRYFTRTGTYSIGKARRMLGYEPRVDLAEGMARTERWLQDHNLIGYASRPRR